MGDGTVVPTHAIDPASVALIGQMASDDRSSARAALREVAAHGWPTDPNVELIEDQLKSLTRKTRYGLRRFWKAAVAAQLRTNPLPPIHPGRPMTISERPPNVDVQAWALASALAGNQAEYARRGLLSLAARGIATDLAFVPTVAQITRLRLEQRIAVTELWSEAHRRGLRAEPAPAQMAAAPLPPPPAGIDAAAWVLAQGLLGARPGSAHDALRALARAGHPTHLDAVIKVEVFVTLSKRQRWALRTLWDAAIGRGLRSAPSITAADLHLKRQDLTGIDRAMVEHLKHLCDGTDQRGVRIWLRTLRDAGLPTDHDADLDTPEVRAIFTDLTDRASKHELYRGTDELFELRAGLRHLYMGAAAAGLRSRPVPTYIAKPLLYARGERASLFARLPATDQAKIDLLREHLLELNRIQQASRSLPIRRSRYAKKRTEAQGNSKSKLDALSSFLHHAAEWELEDLARAHGSGDAPAPSPWRIEAGFLALATPEHVARWAYRGHKPDGTPKAPATSEKHAANFLRLLERSEEARIALLPAARRQEIAGELQRFRVEEEWNVPQDTDWTSITGDPGDDDLDDTGKWFPTLAELASGIARLKARYDNAQQRHGAGRGTARQFWRATRDYVLAYGALICMWRVDTAATIDLARLTPDPQTRRKRWRDGSIHIRSGARAKQSGNRSYFVPDLLIPSEIVDLIEMLLQLEGRSLEHPLAPGEASVRLSTDDRWGRDRLLEGERVVIPLFRKEPDAPGALQYGGVSGSLGHSLLAMGWDAINPHTLRAGGAIEWRYVRDRSYAAIMRLGLWSDERTLKRCYARLGNEDLDAEIARGAESTHVSPADATALIGALDEAHKKALEIRTKANATPVELVAAARVLHATAVTLERAAGVTTVDASPSRFRDPAHYGLVDQLVRSLVPGGLNEFLQYEVIADPTAKRATAPRSDGRILRRLREEMARPMGKPAAAKRIA